MDKQFVIQPHCSREGLFAAVRGYINSLPDDKPWLIEIGKLKKRRTDRQNRALWACAYAVIAEETGNDPEDLHQYFCGEFFGWDEYDVMGQLRKRPRRSTTKDGDGEKDVIPTEEFVKFFDFIQYRAAEVGIFVPDPDPNWRKEMKEQSDKEKEAA
jgi:hypothetical protein